MRITKENIFDEIKKKKNYLEVFKSDLVDKVKDEDGWTPLHFLAQEGVKEVLSHPSVDKVKGNYGWTPLHWLAWEGVKEVLSHPSVDIVKDNNGATPLHELAYNGVNGVFNHISIDQVKDNQGWTPLHRLAHYGHITEEDLRNKYPWYKKEIGSVYEAVEEIINTPKSIQFILEDS